MYNRNRLHLKHLDEISGSYWVELNSDGDPQSYKCWHPNSKYIHPEIFMEFHRPLIETKVNFGHYGPNLFMPMDQTNFLSLLDNFPAGKFKTVKSELMDFFKTCREEHRVIWILGI